MGKGNAFLNKLANQREFDDAVVRAVTQQWVLDMVTIALGRLGWARSQVRMGQFDAMMQEVTREYAELAEDERRAEKNSKKKEFVYLKTKLDDELKIIVGDKFSPYEERYTFHEDQLRKK